MRVKCANCSMIYDRTDTQPNCPRCRSNAFDPYDPSKELVNPYTPLPEPKTASWENDPCSRCSNHSSNGGSGICLCTLGQRTFYTSIND